LILRASNALAIQEASGNHDEGVVGVPVVPSELGKRNGLSAMSPFLQNASAKKQRSISTNKGPSNQKSAASNISSFFGGNFKDPKQYFSVALMRKAKYIGSLFQDVKTA
jgi:hypothetical protein